MADPRMSFRSTGGRSLYSVDEEGGEEEYSYYDDEEEYYDDEEEYYDDEEQYSPRGGGRGGDDRFNKSAMRSTNRYSANNHRGGGRGGGGGRELVEYDDGDDYDSYADDYYDDRGGGGGRGRGGRHYGGNYNSRGNNRRGSRNNNSGERKLVSILPGTPKQAQDIIRQYSLGMPLKYATHMALPPTTPPEGPAREIATLQVANLVPQEYAFVRRSNGQWCFAQLAVRHDSLEQMVFIVNKGGSTKTFKRFEWPGFVRRIKWTERRVQLPPKPLKEIPNGNTGAEGTGQQQLALENGNTKSSSAPNNPATQSDKPQQPEVSTMTIKEMKIELQQLGIDFSLFMEKQEFRNAVIDARAEAVKIALIREQQMQHRQEEEEKQQQHHHQQHQNNNNNHNNNDDHGFDNFNEINLNSTLDADLSNLAGQVITLQPQDDEVSELMGDYLLTEYKFQMKVLERERLKNQGAANKMTSINEHGSGNGNVGDGQQSSAYQSGLGQQSSAYQSFNIEGEGDKKLPHYEKMAFAKSQKWGSVSEEV